MTWKRRWLRFRTDGFYVLGTLEVRMVRSGRRWLDKEPTNADDIEMQPEVPK